MDRREKYEDTNFVLMATNGRKPFNCAEKVFIEHT